MSVRRALEDVVALFGQACDVVGSLRTSEYVFSDDALGCSGVGAHVRHCLDCADCLICGIDSGRVDYDARERSAEVECSPDSALFQLRSTIDRLRALRGVAHDAPLLVRADGSRWEKSSAGRELVFLQSHTTHHLALIAMALRLQKVRVPAEFGIAASTRAHRSRKTAKRRAKQSL